MSEIIVQVEDSSLLPSLRKAIAMLRGVVGVKVPRAPRKSGVELGLEDVKAGRIHEVKDVDELFEQLIDTGTHSDLFDK